MRINNNLQALNAWRQVSRSDNNLSRSLERLSSGMRINRAADDAAGLAVSEKMRSQLRGLNQATRNAEDGISLLQTAEGALQEVTSMVQRMRELALQAANDTLTQEDRLHLNKEVRELLDAIDQAAVTIEYNKTRLLDGSFVGKHIRIEVSGSTETYIRLTFGAMTCRSLSLRFGASGSISISTQSKSLEAIGSLEIALTMISSERATMGAFQNRLEHAITNLGTTMENLTAAESRIRDVDMAAEAAQFTKNQILIQSGTAMLAQANMKPQAVLQLLQ